MHIVIAEHEIQCQRASMSRMPEFRSVW